jgi:chorismate-pyruvate lyase
MQVYLQTLVELFHPGWQPLGRFDEVAADAMPANARRLLAHENHMTVTVEAFHDSLVDVQVIASRLDDRHYAREILLTRQSDGRVVQYGIMRVNFRFVDDEVREEIIRRDVPLGRILIQHNVLREVQLQSLWRIEASPLLARRLGSPVACQGRLQASQCDVDPDADAPLVVFGRTALIYCNGEPAVELLEIVAPCD